MVEYISSWARQVIIAVIVAIILEMILSNKSKSTKYIKTVIGIYVMYTIIAPGFNLIGRKIDFSSMDYENYFYDSEVYRELEDKIEEKSNENFAEVYELNLKQDIETKLREKGYEVSNIKFNINYNEKSEEYGKINKIEVKLSKIKEKEENKNVSIEKIIIENRNNSKVEITSDEEKNLKEFLNKEYCIELDKIIIK